MKTIKLRIDGMSCASCVNNVETALKKTEGVKEARVNITDDSATVTFDESVLRQEEVLSAIRESGYEPRVQDGMKFISMHVRGMTCATCVNNVDKAVAALAGVADVNVNISNDRLTLRYDPDTLKLTDIKKAVADAGYEAVLEADIKEDEDPELAKMELAKKRMKRSAILAGVIMVLMMVQMLVYAVPRPLYTTTVALLAFPIIFYFGRHVLIAAYKSLKNLRPNMDVLVSMGSLPPYLIGLSGIFIPLTTFVEMAAAIMTFHLIGKFLETRAKGKASQAIKKLIELGAKTARVLVDGQEVEVHVNELAQGDIMIVRPGEKIPTDGIVVAGESAVDESIATGESMPVNRKKGDEVIGATINKQGVLKIEVTKIGEDTFLNQVIRMVEEAQGSKVPIQEFADRITGYFVPAVMVITALTFTSFLLFTDFHVGILAAVENVLPWVNADQSALTLAFITATAVLVISCPCALGLGTPTALMVGSGKGADHGILIRNGEAVQTLKDIRVIAFDKTGTLTHGEPRVTDFHAVKGDDKTLMRVAGSIEKGSEHPLAQAVLEKAEELGVELVEAEGFEAISGQGVQATLEAERVFIGNRALMRAAGIAIAAVEDDVERLENEGKTVVMVASEDALLGYIAIADALKPGAAEVIKAIERMGIKTAMITGDNERTANAIAEKLGITRVIAGILPDGKVAEIVSLQEENGLVAMVGDGINDAPALKQANVGMAIGTGTDVAIEAADVTLVRGDLETILAAVKLSKSIFRKIKQNYFWAWFYNAVAIPFAMFGLLHPMIGAAAMSVSSLNVVYNSLRLRKIRLKGLTPHEA